MSIFPGGAPLTIVDGVRSFGASQPSVTAVVDGPRRVTYGQLESRSSRLAQALLGRGHRPGDRIAVLLDNRLEYCEIAAGIAKAGMVMVPLNPRLSTLEISYITEHSKTEAVVVDNAYRELVPSLTTIRTVLAVDGDSPQESYDAALMGAEPTDPLLASDERAPFCVAYTSGTTGRPKGVVISHRSRSLTFLACALEWDLGVGRRSIAVAPMSHGAGFAFGFAPVHTGGTVSMLRSWDAGALLAMIESDRAQSVFLVPTHAQMLRQLGDERIRAHDLSSLDTLFFNAAALPTQLKDWVMTTFPGVGVHELYGSTEGGIVANLRPEEARRKPGSVGHPWFMSEVRVVDDNGAPVGPGEPGELYSRSPFLMNGYLDDPDATAACTTHDGFLTCGDIVVRDDEGYLYIVDRKKDVVITGGLNVYPREVEEQIRTHTAVQDVAVFGEPDPTWGERVVAAVVLMTDSTLDLEQLHNHLITRLAKYKLPRRLVLVDQLPRNAAGKVLKRHLRDSFAELPNTHDRTQDFDGGRT